MFCYLITAAGFCHDVPEVRTEFIRALSADAALHVFNEEISKDTCFTTFRVLSIVFVKEVD